MIKATGKSRIPNRREHREYVHMALTTFVTTDRHTPQMSGVGQKSIQIVFVFVLIIILISATTR